MLSNARLPELSLDRRRAILQREIQRYVANGYRVQNQTSTGADLTRRIWWRNDGENKRVLVEPCRFPFGPPFRPSDECIFLSVDIHGRIHKREQSFGEK